MGKKSNLGLRKKLKIAHSSNYVHFGPKCGILRLRASALLLEEEATNQVKSLQIMSKAGF